MDECGDTETAAVGPRRASLGLSLRLESSVGELAEEWDALADRQHAPPFLRPGWIAAWWQAFGEGTLELWAVGRGGKLAGVLPLARRRGVLRSPTNWHTPQFGLLADDDAARDRLLEPLFQHYRRRSSLAFLDAGSLDLPRLRAAAQAARWRFLERPLERSPYIEIDQDWASYERRLSGNLRRDVGRCLRRLAEQGRLDLDVADGRTSLEERLDEVFAIESAGWKETRGTAILSRPDTERFYREIARWAAERGSLRLVFLRLNGRALAFHFALEEDGAYYPLKGGFDPPFGSFSPGKLIIHATLERAFTSGLARFEFLGGDEPYKRVWATSVRERMLFQAFPRNALGLADWFAFAYGRPLVKRVLRLARRE